MKFDWTIATAAGLALLLALAALYARRFHGVELMIFIALLALVAVAAAAALVYFHNRNKQAKAAPAAAGGAAPAGAPGDAEVDTLVREADHRLAAANAGATIANLPLIFVIGDKSTAKTSTVLNSGIEPELLAGHIYQDNTVAPTRAANLWFARGTALVEAGGGILGDPGNWLRLVKRLQPGKLKSLKGGAQSPRAVLLCVSLEVFTQQGGADAIAAAGRYLQARLADISQTLGIRFPVYILFTKSDRVPFFTDFVNTFSNDEASQVFGATVPIRPPQQTGVYAEDETRRLTGYFDNLFYSLCDKRTVFPPRDNEMERVYGAYEFPREVRKIRDLMVQFMVDVCRPSQLMTSPFLRGFYFSGVRPIVVSDAAPIVASRPQQADYQSAGASGATGMFRVGKQAEMLAQQSVAQPVAASRKVPQWMFLGHLFNNVIFADTAAMSASGSSVKVSALRRGLLIAAAVLCLLLCGIFTYSYFGNRALEKQAIAAAAAIPARDVPAKEVAALAPLQQLEILRQSLEQLEGYENDGAPYGIRWGLYQGSNMYPEVRRLYYAKFKALLFGQTQSGLVKFMQSVKAPPSPEADYPYPYNTLKAYLLTTNEYKRASDKSLQEFLGNLLLTRWSENREPEIGKERMDLARKQFDYYARNLSSGNPYSDKGDEPTITGTRVYLAGFKGVKRVYYGMLAEASKKGKSQSFNDWAPGSATVLNSSHQVIYPFTTKGAAYMLDQIRKANFGGEAWVLGPYATKPGDEPEMQKGIQDLFLADYIKEWRTVLRTSHVVPYKSLKDAADKLDQLTKSDAPILAVLSWTSQNTNINEMPDVKDAFRVPQQVEPPNAPSYVPSAQSYNDALQGLQVAIAKVAETSNDPALMSAAQNAADSARQATNKFSSTFSVDRDPAGQLDKVVGALMLEPITEADKKLKGMGAEELNSKGAGFCGSFGPITKKFPFNPAASDEATLQEIAGIFAPNSGKLWQLYEGGVKKVIVCTGSDCALVDKPPVQVNPAFVTFFRQAVKFSKALYGDSGTEPNFKYSLTPKKSDQVSTFILTVNGEQSKLDGGTAKSFVWPGAKHNFKVDLGLASGGVLEGEMRETLWAAFRFFADADRAVTNGNSYDFFWSVRQGRENKPLSVNGHPLIYTFTFEANGAPAIFSKEFLAGMRCIPTIAK